MNVAPWPGALSIRIEPPCASTEPFTSVNPRPQPRATAPGLCHRRATCDVMGSPGPPLAWVRSQAGSSAMGS
jgi:hypothetical protein